MSFACYHFCAYLTLRLVFAPVALLIPYKDVEEAIDIANGTRYGLGASVWGPVQRECVEVAKRLECGMVSVNDFAVFYLKFVCLCYACQLQEGRS